MAKKITGYVKLQIPAGEATPAPPVGPALGQQGVNIMDFCKNFNAKTAGQDGLIIPVVVTVFADRSYTFVLKTPPAPILSPERMPTNELVASTDPVHPCGDGHSVMAPVF